MELSATRLRSAVLRLALLSAVFVYGVGVGRYEIFPYEQIRSLRNSLEAETETETEPDPYGRWHEARESLGSSSPDQETLDNLSALGYLGGYETAENAGGVTILDSQRVRHGLTLFSSGHAPVVYLMSLAGEIVHKWQVTFEKLWPGELPFEVDAEHRQFIRRAHVFPNGDLLAIFEYVGIFKLDRNSNVIWKSLTQNHHDFTVSEDGTIVTLVRHHLSAEEVAEKYPGFQSPPSGIDDDQVVFLDASGEEQNRISLFEAFYRSDYGLLLTQRDGYEDVFHANSVDIIENRRVRPLVEGELLISLRTVNAIVSLDISEKRITWLQWGMWRGQHQAELLENGNILLLDNRGGNRETPLVYDQSELIEIDPATQEIVWKYRGSDEFPFFTAWLGYVQRLDNGNTLVSESAQGRLFEVSKSGRIVWEYMNPNRTGQDNELIATIMGGQRLREEDLEFLERVERKPVAPSGDAE